MPKLRVMQAVAQMTEVTMLVDLVLLGEIAVDKVFHQTTSVDSKNSILHPLRDEVTLFVSAVTFPNWGIVQVFSPTLSATEVMLCRSLSLAPSWSSIWIRVMTWGDCSRIRP